MISPLKRAVGVALAAWIAQSAGAIVVTQWNFNTLDGDGTTGTTSPNIGTGTLTPIGDIKSTYIAGGQSDPNDTIGVNSTDNSSYVTSTYPSTGTASGSAGVQFAVSTSGMTDPIQICFDVRQTATASKYVQLQASTNGSTFSNVSGGAASIQTSPSPNTNATFSGGGLYSDDPGSASQTFVQGVKYTLPMGAGFENNANFAFRLVSIFDPTGSDYTAANGASYGTTGTIRYDMVTVATVPEPVSIGVLTLATAFLRRRRRSD